MIADGAFRESAARSRLMLRRIREALARAGDGRERLDRIVRLVATSLIAEVCSIYLIGPEDDLVLSATEGLNQDAVGLARLRVGQGLVGRICETGESINTDDAARQPGFQYLPGTGEEIYRSFLGSPIQRQGHTLGVLVVQNRAARIYDDEEVEALELIATVIAEMTDAGAFFSGQAPIELRSRGPRLLSGVPAAEGVAMGRVVLHEPKVVLPDPIAENVEAERARLRDAMDKIRSEVDELVAGEGFSGRGAGVERSESLTRPGEHRDVLEAFRLVAHDKGWLRRLEEAVESGLKAEAAVEKVQTETRTRLQRTEDPYLRERLSDLDDLANRLLRSLLGLSPPAPEDLPEDAVLVAEALGPGELIEYGRGRLKALALDAGSASGHAAIVARALNIPLVAALKDLRSHAEAGDPVIVDGDVGRVLLRPDGSVAQAYREKLALRAQEQAALKTLRDLPAETLDGARIELHMNAGLLTDLPSLPESGAEGVGLYRTELQYLVNSRAPRRDAQARLYEKVLDTAGARPVIFRTLDMGGDKRLPFLKGDVEENPALGWRAIRIALDRPGLFRIQLQAMIRAAEGRPLSVMFPMIATVDEFERARALLLDVREKAVARGWSGPTELRIGAMLETPALAFAPDRFFETADFISIGGNDLAQFFFAADRGNERVRGRYAPLDAAFFRFVRLIVERCERSDVELSFCGELAGSPAGALALSAIGLRKLSMRPTAIGPVKRLLRSVELSAVAQAVDAALDAGASDLTTAVSPYQEALAAAE